jgi:hypothetical protein
VHMSVESRGICVENIDRVRFWDCHRECTSIVDSSGSNWGNCHLILSIVLIWWMMEVPKFRRRFRRSGVLGRLLPVSSHDTTPQTITYN